MRAPCSRRVLVTGAASGIGLETSVQLARRGDHVIIADRNISGGEAVVQHIVDAGGSAEFHELDLADLARIRAFAAEEIAQDLPLDVLINNAGLLPPMVRATTRDGFELEFGVAHLGHYALTGLLLPVLQRSDHPRVVSVSSISHASGRIVFDDLQYERNYNSTRVYAGTKLACLLFALELQRRATEAGSKLISVAAHPGISITPIAAGWEQEDRRKLRDRLELIAYRVAIRLFGRTAAEGAQSLVYAASEPDVIGGGYYGPTGFQQMCGPPGLVQPSLQALDTAIAGQLWKESEQLTGVHYGVLGPMSSIR